MMIESIMKEVSDIIEDEKILKCVHGLCKNKDKILDSNTIWFKMNERKNNISK